MFSDETAPFQDDVMKVGCYLRPSIDAGPPMTAKVLTQNGRRSTDQHIDCSLQMS